MNRFTEFYRISSPAPAREMDADARSKYYRRLRLQAFAAATLGYSLYYVSPHESQCHEETHSRQRSAGCFAAGSDRIGALFAYAVGKFVNGFIADYCNIKRFMATGLILSAAVNALMGLLGLAHSVIPTAVIFVTSRRDVGDQRLGTIHGSAPRPSYPSRDGIPPGTGEPTTDSSRRATTSGNSSHSYSWAPS